MVKVGNASSLNEKSGLGASQLGTSYQDLENVWESVKELKSPLGQTTDTLKNELEANKDTIRKSNEHVRNLKYQADRLDEDFDRSRSASERVRLILILLFISFGWAVGCELPEC